jgi:uncharacterized membrane protein
MRDAKGLGKPRIAGRKDWPGETELLSTHDLYTIISIIDMRGKIPAAVATVEISSRRTSGKSASAGPAFQLQERTMKSTALRTALRIAAVLFAVSLPVAAGAQDLAAGSVWVNANNSTMTLTSVDPTTGLMTGTFVTGVGCGVGVVRPLSGFFNQGAITLTVNFQDCQSATSWTGQLSGTGNQIVTLWYLAVSGTPAWNSIIAGTDVFTRQ